MICKTVFLGSQYFEVRTDAAVLLTASIRLSAHCYPKHSAGSSRLVCLSGLKKEAWFALQRSRSAQDGRKGVNYSGLSLSSTAANCACSRIARRFFAVSIRFLSHSSIFSVCASVI
jgi:hypothetical protein